MHALMDLLAEVLRLHGLEATRNAALEGQSGTVYTVPLLLEGEAGAFIVDAHLDGVVPAQIQDDLEQVREDVGADGAVLCHLGAAETTDTPVRRWGHDDLVRLIGTARLAEATGAELAPIDLLPEAPLDAGPLAESLDDLLPPAFAAPEPELPAMTVMDLDALETMDLEPDLEPEPPAPVPDEPFTRPLLPVRCLPEEARLKVRERLFEAHRVEAVLQPVHLFDYECDLLVEGSLRYDTVRGRIQVHGTDKTVVEVDPEAVDPSGFTRMTGLDRPAEERVLRTSDERAKERARHFLVEAHTRVVDVQVDDDDHGFAYTEKKPVAPRPDHVRLNHLGTFHRVIWRVRGPNGHVDVDALTGEPIQETLATPDPDVYIMD